MPVVGNTADTPNPPGLPLYRKFGSLHRPKKIWPKWRVNPCTVRVGTTDIKPVSEVRNLGSWFDSNFSMFVHISKSCSAAFFWLHNTKQISTFLASAKLEIVLHDFITSRIDYCNGLLYGLPDCKLQRVQKAVARLLTSSRKYGHITPVLKELHCLPPHFTRSDTRVRFDSGVIFLDQSQFFVTHSNQ